MAESLLGVAVENLISLVQNEFATFSGIKQTAEELSRTLPLIKAVLDDAEEKQFDQLKRPIKVWLQQLKDAMYVLDDILDDCSASESIQLGFLSSIKPKNILFRRKVGHRLKEMKGRLDQIAQAQRNFALCERAVRERPNEVAEWRQTSSTIANPQVYGRVEDKEKVVEFLCSPARGSDSLSVYSIVGLGGFGKTTLAQLVYNDQRVSAHFDLKIWVCVSENFDHQNILCSIIESITKDKYVFLSLDLMEQRLKELLKSKRYFLVLDDVWKRNEAFEFGLCQDKWDNMKRLLSYESKGASVLVSTRDEHVAAIMGTFQAHHLSGLTDDDCWSLFKQRAFGSNNEECSELVAIGKEIVKKCKGSPLAAKALGALLRFRSGVKEWIEVKESKFWTLPHENKIFRALSLSYFYLTPTSKQCFAICAIFPKDATIMKYDLIHLWMANGFISSRKKLDVEEVGNMIWNELYQKSFFQDVNMNDDSGNISFKMHDLVHDLAQSITESECMCLEKTNMDDLSRNTHHIGFGVSGDSSQTSFKKEAFQEVESLRTLYQLKLHKTESSGWFPANRSLRVLRTSSYNLSLLGKLTHLRYLELSDMDIVALPDSIYNLRKLEILKLVHLGNLCCLPKHLTRLQNLRHLVIRGCGSLSRMSPDIHKLSHLRTLSVYIVEKEKGHSLAELCCLNLGGELSIEDLENVRSLSEAQEANLKDKNDLRELHLSWSNKTNSRAANVEQVLEVLQPHSNLKVLSINWYEGLNWPSWMGNNSVLSNLVSLDLYVGRNCQKLPPLGKLPSLRKLEIRYMDNVQYIMDEGVEGGTFPSLEELTLRVLPKLEGLLKVERGDMFPRLSSLQLFHCPKLKKLPHLPCAERLSVRLNETVSFAAATDNGIDLSGSEDVTTFPEGMMNSLPCLKSLDISCCEKLKKLPNEITKLSALESLEIKICGALESLPEEGLEGLCSLKTLEILACPRLRSLPDGVRHLSSLETLIIGLCPEELKERCKEGTGEDWHKISHIPNVDIH